MQKITRQLADEIKISEAQVRSAVELLDGGATVPFIARYRKEVTGGLDDSQLRTLESRLGYLRELEDRRQVNIRSIEEQGKLQDAMDAGNLWDLERQLEHHITGRYSANHRHAMA